MRASLTQKARLQCSHSPRRRNLVIFCVEKPQTSAAFYSALLQRPPVESTPTFALFVLGSPAKLGLWSLHGGDRRGGPGRRV